jgi:V-type H+-transporting ATPase subunit H
LLPFEPLLRYLTQQDNYAAIMAAKTAVMIACHVDPRTYPPAQLQPLLVWLANATGGPDTQLSDVAIQLLASLLRVTQLRRPYFDTPKAMPALVDLLKKNPTHQQRLYQSGFCLWLLSFDEGVAADMDRMYDVIPAMLDTARSSVKEKVIRVLVATLRNMVDKAVEANIGSMLVHRLLPFMESLATRKWSDEELPSDIQVIRDALNENLQHLSSWDAYVAELESGKLEWTPPHTSVTFWRTNATRLNDKQHELLKHFPCSQ